MGHHAIVIERTAAGSHGATIPLRLLRIINRPVMALVRVLRGQGLRIAGRPLLVLTTIGARSGRRRQVPLLWFRDQEEGWIIVASSGGMATHPAWFGNLVKNPDQVWIEVDGRTVSVRAESLAGQERAAVWSRITTEAPIYHGYQAKTDREIPVIRLRAVPVPRR